MISEKEYNVAVEQKEFAQKIINEYNREQMNAFDLRMKENPVFTDEELKYSAVAHCPCGHGLAYPKGCHYWDCSAILKGIADPGIKHIAQLPFIYFDIKGESESRGSTRGVFLPKES
jgi:hypothetical protein